MRSLALACLLVATTVAADSWLPPQPRAWHDAGPTRVVEVFPAGSRHGDARSARAFVYAVTANGPRTARLVWQGPLANDKAPVEAIVTPAGELVTLDNWGARGHTHAVVIYDRAGKRLRAYAYNELLLPDSVRQRVRRSVSSIYWLEGAVFTYHARTRSLLIGYAEGWIALSLADGKQRWVASSKLPPGVEVVRRPPIDLQFASITDVLAAP